MKVIHHHYLASIDLSKRTGVFMYRTPKCTEWIKIDVSISPLLASRIKDRGTNKYERLPINIPYVGYEFITELTSPKYEDSPFKLIQYKPVGNSNIPMNFQLDVVDRESKSIKDIITGKTISYKNWTVDAKDFMRCQPRKVKAFVQDLSPYVLPNIVRIPIV